MADMKEQGITNFGAGPNAGKFQFADRATEPYRGELVSTGGSDPGHTSPFPEWGRHSLTGAEFYQKDDHAAPAGEV